MSYRIDPEIREVVVHHGKEYAVLLVVSYFLDESRRERGFEFFERLASAPVAMPTTGKATFTQELRGHGFAPRACSHASKTAEDFIRDEMSLAYGPEAKIQIEKVTLHARPSAATQIT